jgi:hypothetical protein
MNADKAKRRVEECWSGLPPISAEGLGNEKSDIPLYLLYRILSAEIRVIRVQIMRFISRKPDVAEL